MEQEKYRLNYRSDIEGLRAVAILLVIAAHASVPWLAGGFVGVDVFFVLSGYLITGLILQEVETTAQLKFANFYARRLRRLLPALLVMLLCTSLIAAITLAPAAQSDQSISAATASLWLSNIHFAFDKLDYFSPGATSNLFLHTWSLGVEEQFYLVWPALILWTLGKHIPGVEQKNRLKAVMWTVAVVSAALCIMLTRSVPQMAFYMMPLRAWQFSAGALVWLYFNRSAKDAQSANSIIEMEMRARYWCGWLGLALILGSGFLFSTDASYPGWRALLPTLGATAIIAAGAQRKPSGVTWLLSWAPLQATGRVSYSWYLWHWPVLLLGYAVFGDSNPTHRTILVGVSLLLAIASYRWVESPVRHQSIWIARPGRTIVGAIVLMLITNVLCISWFNATENWLNGPNQKRYAQAHHDAPAIYEMGCDDWYHSDTLNPCSFGPKEASHTVVLMGDSVGAQWFSAVATAFDHSGWRLFVLTKSACPMVDEQIFYPRIGREYAECDSWRRKAIQQIVAWRPDIVLLGSDSAYDLDQKQIINGTARLLDTISKASEHVYILRGTPHLPFDGPNCLSSQSWLHQLRPWKTGCAASAGNPHDDDVYRWQQQASRSFNNVSLIDMNAYVCPQDTCRAESEGHIIFRDSQHLTNSYVESLSEELARKIAPKGSSHVP